MAPPIYHSLKVKILKRYLKFLLWAKRETIKVFFLLVLFCLFVFGLELMIIAGVLLSSLDTAEKLWILFGIGSFLVGIGILCAAVFLSDSFWLRKSQAQALLENISEEVKMRDST